MKKQVCIIYTGGTIGMTKTEEGYYAPKTQYLAGVLEQMPELRDGTMPDYTLMEMEPLLDSSNVAVGEWNKIGQLISDHYHLYDGFLVLHGTDTMAYTASALSFMFENLGKPVVLTGSQIPFCELRNDARLNLITALMLAQEDHLHEVCLCFGGKLLRGARSTKVSAEELNAFESPNYPPLAQAGVALRLERQNLLPKPTGDFRFHPFAHHPIAVLKIFPGIQFDIFKDIVTPELRGIVLEAFGAGNIPIGDNGLSRLLSTAAGSGTALVVCTQCLRGSAQLGLYEASAPFRKAGVISGGDMTVEAAVTKLYYLLSQNYAGDELKALMETDLRGELSLF